VPFALARRSTTAPHRARGSAAREPGGATAWGQPAARRAGARPGVTLVEVVVVLGLLGMMAALVLPPLVPPAPRTATLPDVVRAARAAALARAQTLQLTVTAAGRWHLHPLPPLDRDTLARGTLARGTLAGAPPLQLQLTPLGACLASPPVPPLLAGWDAAACRPTGNGEGANASASARPEVRP